MGRTGGGAMMVPFVTVCSCAVVSVVARAGVLGDRRSCCAHGWSKILLVFSAGFSVL